MDNSIVLKSYGKINLGLDVLRRREDGYHEVRMIMQTVGLYDLLTMKKIKDDKIKMTCNLAFLPTDERNLVYKAVKLIKDKYHIKDGVEIELSKRIPVAAGMAGGTPYRACAEMAGGIGSADCGSGAAGRVRRSKRDHPRHAAPDRPDARRLPEANAIGTKKQESGTRLPDPPVILSVPA